MSELGRGPTHRPDEPVLIAVEAPKSTFDDDAAHVRVQLQETYPKEHPTYNNQEGTRIITEALTLTEALLKKNIKEGDPATTIKEARRELESGIDTRISAEVPDITPDENLLTLIDLIIDQAPGELLFDLATGKDGATAVHVDTLATAYKTREVKPVSDDQLPALIKNCARHQLIAQVGSDYFDKLSGFEKKRAGSANAFDELESTVTPPSTQA